MSQPNNYPNFSYNVNEPFNYPQPPQVGNGSFPQWPPPGSRTLGGIPSPSPSIRTTMTAPNARSPHRPNVAQPNLLQQNHRIDPNLSNVSFLAVPAPPARPRSAVGNSSNVDPVLSRVFRSLNDGPWSSERMRNSNYVPDRSSFSQPTMSYEMYRGGPGSDIDSVAPRSDSGYYTHQAQSVISNEPGRVDQELPPEMTYQVDQLNVDSASSEPTELFPAHSDRASQYSVRSTTQSKGTYKCTKCKEISKCPSDFKKHMLKHEKPHRCDVPGCRRAAAGKGFTTINDLTRHKKSVHRIGVDRDSYQCASENCRNKGKVWPRLDNFKQHINRMHKGEDEQDLIRRSAYRGPSANFAADALSVAPMDTTLAGIGTEKQFAGSELDDPASGISLTPDQDSSHWNAFDSNPRDFAMDVDRTNPVATSHRFQTGNNPGHDLSNQPQSSNTSPASGPRRRQDSLSVLADAASTQAPPRQPGPPTQRQLSSAPQTKAEQQREALQKFSKVVVGAIQNASSSEPVDLENVVLQVLYRTTNHRRRESNASNATEGPSAGQGTAGNMGTDIVLTKAEALKASQAISNLIKQSGAPPFTSRPRRPSKGFTTNAIKCNECSTTLSRSCDMKKHMKRHTKPYGCTFAKCHKRFGAKSDWKRHENSQHFQLESFRCQQICASSQTPCGELFYRAEIFRKHLQTEHKVTQEEQLAHELKARRIGKNGQGQFWCGFCAKIVRLEKRRSAAWDERFDHIDRHFNKEKRSIEEWLCVEAKKTKGEVLKEIDRMNFDEEDMGDYGECETDETPPPSGVDGNGAPQGQPSVSSASSSMPAPTFSSQAAGLGSRKRQAAVDIAGPSSAPKRRRREVAQRYCCVCQDGPWSSGLVSACVSCNHHLCQGCPVISQVVALEGSVYT